MADELVELRRVLLALESGHMTIRARGEDVTEREAVILRREIATLEAVLARRSVLERKAQTQLADFRFLTSFL